MATAIQSQPGGRGKEEIAGQPTAIIRIVVPHKRPSLISRNRKCRALLGGIGNNTKLSPLISAVPTNNVD